MKHLILLLLALMFASPVVAQTEKTAKVSNHETDKQAEDKAIRQNLRDRLNALEAALKSVQWEPHKSPGLDAPERKADQEGEKWLLEIRQDVKMYVRNLDKILKSRVLDAQAVLDINAQFRTLQERIQNESRQFTSVSNVLKTRHDTVKNSIGNIR